MNPGKVQGTSRLLSPRILRLPTKFIKQSTATMPSSEVASEVVVRTPKKTSDKRFVCQRCQRHFSRLEHLQRHDRTRKQYPLPRLLYPRIVLLSALRHIPTCNTWDRSSGPDRTRPRDGRPHLACHWLTILPLRHPGEALRLPAMRVQVYEKVLSLALTVSYATAS